jgi:Sulfotransferase domain
MTAGQSEPQLKSLKVKAGGTAPMDIARTIEANCLPNLIIIGAMKCGTTSLHYNLGLHPDISMTREKELHFFIGGKNWKNGLPWYRSHFSPKTLYTGESSPTYTMFPFIKDVVARMYDIIPEARLIYIVRNPIRRIISHYIHRLAIGEENRPIDAALVDFPDNPFIQGSRYYFQLSQYFGYFPDSHIHIMTLESLRDHPAEAMSGVFRFLGVNDHFYSPKFLDAMHKSSEKGRKNQIGLLLKKLSDSKVARLFSTDTRMQWGRLLYAPFSKKIKKPEISEPKRQAVLEYLNEDIAKLQAYTGLKMDDWMN